MGQILKILLFLLVLLVALIILVMVVPLLWIFLKEVGGLFGGITLVAEGQFGWFLLTLVIIAFIIWLWSRD